MIKQKKSVPKYAGLYSEPVRFRFFVAMSNNIRPVVKVRGNAGERRSWAPKIAGERSLASHSR